MQREPIMIDDRTFAHRSRGGSKLHRSHWGSSGAECGYWARVQTSQLAVCEPLYNPDRFLCDKCFPPGSEIRAAAVDALKRP